MLFCKYISFRLMILRGYIMKISVLGVRPAGYVYLQERFEIEAIRNWHISYVADTGVHRLQDKHGLIEETYAHKYWPGDSVGDHIEFALKYDGVNLAILKNIFSLAPENEIIDYIKSRPTGKYTRKIWFLFEFLMGRKLPIDDVTSGNYTDVLDSNTYYNIANGEKNKRQRVVNNLLGPKEFCPIIRKTDKLLAMDSINWQAKCEEVIVSYSPDLIRRALSYLYNKETKSSFEIENIKPSALRVEKFIALLELAEEEDFCKKNTLIELQNKFVDPRFKCFDYRESQNYVGQTVVYQKEVIHYVCPKPEDLHSLMEGLISAHQRMKNGRVPAVVHAAAISYGFVFIHPFEDGNGRIHRFLIHNILSLAGVVPTGLMFPVSAVMLKNKHDYNSSLEAFSRPLLQLVEYGLDELGQMTVMNNTAPWYKYIDMTSQAEALFNFVRSTVDEELGEEINFLANYDVAKKSIQDIIDMPDRLIDLFILLCHQNNGRLSLSKRNSHFDFLTDDELVVMEQQFRDVYKSKVKSG
jgi:hypothetical protein